jgi:hypothetical protein
VVLSGSVPLTVPVCFGWPRLLVVGLALVVALVLVAVSVERLIVPVCFG